jgi:adenosylhomocysteinase
VEHDVRDITLAEEGRRRIDWADREMPVLRMIRERFAEERPFAGKRIAASLHVTAETANLMRALTDGGAEVVLCAANPLSTQDDVAAALVAEFGVRTYAVKGEDHDTYYRHINAAADHRPHVVLDDGADLIGILHAHRREHILDVIAATEGTATGVVRLKAMEAEQVLAFPVIAVNEAQTKQLFDNRYGTGQSAVDGILRATNQLLAGRTFVVGGYGYCGRGIADRARGAGSIVVIVEVDPVRALQATMDGFRVLPMAEAAAVGDLFCTATGSKHVLRGEHFEVMKDGAILANAGHFNIEVDVPALRAAAVEVRVAREHVDEYVMEDGRRLYLLAEGRLVNLAVAEGHPAAVMDMSFSNHALSIDYLMAHGGELERRVYVVPDVLDRQIARLKLATLGVRIDDLSAEQERYLASWAEGT